MKKYLLILIALIFYNCKKDLTGHWHAKIINDDSFNTSIDILENNNAFIYNSLTDRPLKGEHFPNNSQILFPGSCGDLSFDYYLILNTLYLENALGVKVMAERIKGNCNRTKDYKSKLDITSLKIINNRKLYDPIDSIENKRLNKYILLKSKDKNIKLEFLDEIKSVDKIDSIIEYIENSVSNAEIPFINYVLVPDKNILMSDLKLVIDSLNKGYRKKIFIQTLKTNPKDLNIFEYIKIDKLDLNSENLLSEIIN